MLYMVVERFKQPGGVEVYRRAKQRGRMLPDGLTYVDSWVDLDFTRCYQLMRCDDERLIDAWIARWGDLVDFEVIAVRHSSEASQRIAEQL